MNNLPFPRASTQTDSIFIYADSVQVIVKKPVPWEPNPKRAGLYSAILPGSGQLYNKQYWKIPIVYAGLGVGAYFINYNLQQYRKYRTAYLYRIDNDPSTGTEDESMKQYSDENLQQLQNDYHKDLDVSVLITSLGYFIQIMDAVASAHLKNFDVSRDISMQMKPMFHGNGIGFGVAMNFR